MPSVALYVLKEIEAVPLCRCVECLYVSKGNSPVPSVFSVVNFLLYAAIP